MADLFYLGIVLTFFLASAGFVLGAHRLLEE